MFRSSKLVAVSIEVSESCIKSCSHLIFPFILSTTLIACGGGETSAPESAAATAHAEPSPQITSPTTGSTTNPSNEAIAESDHDNDGIDDVVDIDDDNDGVIDALDVFPLNATESIDSDEDGIGDNSDPDIDNDGVSNAFDAFPLNSTESYDTDADGIGDNTDPDIDNDGVDNDVDAFPLISTESRDTDSDGIGDNTDPDIDNDGVPNTNDTHPYDPLRGLDTDGDGTEDFLDSDDDNDGVIDEEDAFPLDVFEHLDTDKDGIGNTADQDDDNDSVADSEDYWPLNFDCSSQSETYKGQCIYQFAYESDYIEHDENGHVYHVNDEEGFIFKYDLVKQQWSGVAEINSFPEGHDSFDINGQPINLNQIRKVEYSRHHRRLYIGYGTGVITYIEPQSLDSVFFYQADRQVINLTEAGNFLLVSAYSDDENNFILDSFGVRLYGFDDLDLLNAEYNSDILWLSEKKKVAYIDRFSGIRTFEVNQTTGVVRNKQHVRYTEANKISLPLVSSDNEDIFFVGTGSAFLSDDLEPIDRFPYEFVDARWLTDGAVIALHDNGDHTQLTRYTDEWRVAENITIEGTATKLFEHAGIYYVRADGSSQRYTVFKPSDDTDKDSVPNEFDAFPNDPAASIDTDNDGAPDLWNSGYTKSDSTSGLTLDAYPDDWSCSMVSDGDGSQCNYEALLPISAPSLITASGDGIAYFVYQAENLVARWDNQQKVYLRPVRTGRENKDGRDNPVSFSYSPTMERIYLGYEDGTVSYISLLEEFPEEVELFSTVDAVTYLADAGNFLVVQYSENSSRNYHQYYDHQGIAIDQAIRSTTGISASKWDNLTNRFYYFYRSSFDFRYDQLNDQGIVVQTKSSGNLYDGPWLTGPGAPILLTPDRSRVILGNQGYYDTNSLERIGSIRIGRFGVWTADGRLVTGDSSYSGGFIEVRDETFYPISKTGLPNVPLTVLEMDGELIAVTHEFRKAISIVSLADK